MFNDVSSLLLVSLNKLTNLTFFGLVSIITECWRFIKCVSGGASEIEIIVHFPEAEQDQEFLKDKIAKIHAQYVLHTVDALHCPLEQKIQLIDAIADTVQKTVRKSN